MFCCFTSKHAFANHKDARGRSVARVFIKHWYPESLEQWDEQNFTQAQPVVPLESLPSEDWSLSNMMKPSIALGTTQSVSWVHFPICSCGARLFFPGFPRRIPFQPK